MRPIPLNFVTLYADLAQNVRKTSADYGSVVTRRKRGKGYWYVVSKNGAIRDEQYLGPAGDPEVEAKVAELRQAAHQAKALRSTVSALKQAKFPAPTIQLGRILEVIANAGLFDQGIVLIGTAAFQTYAGVVGHFLRNSALTTQDADLLVASFVGGRDRQDMEQILQRADPTFKPVWNPEVRLPMAFKSKSNFKVEVLTRLGRGRKTPILMDELGCAAEALRFMEYLAEESIEIVALYGAGVLIKVPPPLRYAVHKLLIAQERSGLSAAKKPKDLAQASDLIDVFLETDSAALEDALDEARDRGPKWKRNIDASLREIGRDARQGQLPLPVGKSKARKSS